jgi:molybdopterin-guanine dinucleotide biosynthesis protein A
VQDVTAFIIAGGKSSRMGKGQDKAFLLLHGKMLIEHVIQKAKAVADHVFVVGPKEKFSAYGRVIEDVYRNCGPLGGLHAALNRSRTELSVMLAVDTPFVNFEFLSYMIDEARKNAAWVTVPKSLDGLQPLCGVYRREFLPVADEALKTGKYKIDALFASQFTAILDLGADKVKSRGFNAEMFDNINFPEDLENAAKRVIPKTKASKHS